MEESKNIDVSILSIGGYFKRHFVLCQLHKTQQDAYDALEDEYQSLVKRHRFVSYEAFRTAKSRFYAKQSNR